MFSWNQTDYVLRFLSPFLYKIHFIYIVFIPRYTKSGGVLCCTLRNVWVSVRPSVSPSFPCSNFSIFWSIFFKLCIDIDIGEEWYGITNGLFSFRNNRVMALGLSKKCVFPQYLQNKWMNFEKKIVYALIYEPSHDKINNVVCAPSEDPDQLGHPPSLVRVFAVRSMGS